MLEKPVEEITVKKSAITNYDSRLELFAVRAIGDKEFVVYYYASGSMQKLPWNGIIQRYTKRK